ncbi:MAG: ABC transporter ATP-binding protein [Ruminococcus sp.]|uniref:ABC transporter ATP-binding protein n=1 Tax=Ruminococcus sp. TaxID=41978 RepID=UPI002873CF2C|nr:ABC transporter ATP-binding protein [Ruminococcus sp.]MBQ3284162.1 ABC transporter ATP-binding protein [Ruminococcus sp.]
MSAKQKSALSWIVRSSRPQFINIIFLAVIYGLNAFIGVYNTVFARDLVDAAVKGVQGGPLDDVIRYGLLYLGVTVIQIVTLILARDLCFKVGAKLDMSMKSSLFRSMMMKEYADISAYHSGELMNRLTNDVNVVTSAIVSIVPNLVFFIVKIVGIFYILVRINVLFALVFVVGGALIFVIASLFKPVTKRLHKDVQEKEGKVRSFMQEGLGSLLMIKTFDAQEKMQKSAYSLQEESYRSQRKRNIFSIITGTGMSAVFAFAFVWGLCWGAYMLYYGAISYGVLMQITSLVGQIRTPIQGMTNIFPTYFTALASAERLMEIENLPDEPELNSDIDPQKLYEDMEAICFDDISFAFDRDIVLDSTSLMIKKGEFVAIEGISGIGKSTLMKLLLSVYQPKSGEIYIRTHEHKYIVDKSIRKLFSYVPQGNFLLSGTLRENIAFVAPDATDEDIMHAAHIACAEEFIKELPEGLNTVIAEHGGGLSEGQVQRVAIARAILSGAPVILLDEATSALDEATELSLLENLRELKNKTCILISHKKAAERFCDKTVTIENKKIICR